VTNTVNGKTYIGKHKSPCFDTRYLGSGKLLWAAYDKYGIDKFIMVPIMWCKDEDELTNAEAELIRIEFAANPNGCYNLTCNGKHANSKHNSIAAFMQQYYSTEQIKQSLLQSLVDDAAILLHVNVCYSNKYHRFYAHKVNIEDIDLHNIVEGRLNATKYKNACFVAIVNRESYAFCIDSYVDTSTIKQIMHDNLYIDYAMSKRAISCICRYASKEEHIKTSKAMKQTERRTKSVYFANHYRTKGIFKYCMPITTVDGEFEFKDYHHFIVTKRDEVIVYLWDTREVVYRTNKSNLRSGFVYAHKVDNYEPLIGYNPAELRPEDI
jgi:hypothetical protein